MADDIASLRELIEIRLDHLASIIVQRADFQTVVHCIDALQQAQEKQDRRQEKQDSLTMDHEKRLIKIERAIWLLTIIAGIALALAVALGTKLLTGAVP
jgi:hypothetical protein